MQKKCPKCGRIYDADCNFCSKCAVKLVKRKNRCSSPKCSFCENAILDDEDVVCKYCGAYTDYEIERKEKIQ